jgi:hypothetical protein
MYIYPQLRLDTGMIFCTFPASGRYFLTSRASFSLSTSSRLFDSWPPDDPYDIIQQMGLPDTIMGMVPETDVMIF